MKENVQREIEKMLVIDTSKRVARAKVALRKMKGLEALFDKLHNNGQDKHLKLVKSLVSLLLMYDNTIREKDILRVLNGENLKDVFNNKNVA